MAKVSRHSLARVVAERLLANNADSKAVMHEVAAYLIENNMVDDADVLINDIAEALFQQTGRLVVEVISAHALTEEARQNLTTYLQDATNAKSIELHEMVDESLIGGLIAKTPSSELDISLQNKLRQLTGMVG